MNTPVILIIDKDKEYIDILSTRLKGFDVRIETAFDGEEGLEKARQLKPSLIVLEVGIPKLDGMAVLFKLKGDQELKHIYVILMTALADPEMYTTDRMYAKDMGADDYFMKTNANDILKSIKSFFEKNQSNG